MLSLLLIVAVTTLVVLNVAAVQTTPEPDPPAPAPVDWQAKYHAEHRLAVHRLAGWRKASKALVRERGHVRRLLHQHGTGVPWLNDALCIHGYESTDWRNKGHHFGGMQFTLSTWHRAGGLGNPAGAHPIEQLYRAYRIWSMDGGSWREWSTAPLCGL